MASTFPTEPPPQSTSLLFVVVLLCGVERNQARSPKTSMRIYPQMTLLPPLPFPGFRARCPMYYLNITMVFSLATARTNPTTDSDCLSVEERQPYPARTQRTNVFPGNSSVSRNRDPGGWGREGTGHLVHALNSRITRMRSSWQKPPCRVLCCCSLESFLCVACLCGLWVQLQQRAEAPLEMEFHTDVTCPVGAED